MQRGKLAVCVCQGKTRVAVLLWPISGWQGLLLKFTFNVLLKITPITLFTQEVLWSGLARWPRSKVLTAERLLVGLRRSLQHTWRWKENQLQRVVPWPPHCATTNCSCTHLEISNKLRTVTVFKFFNELFFNILKFLSFRASIKYSKNNNFKDITPYQAQNILYYNTYNYIIYILSIIYKT